MALDGLFLSRLRRELADALPDARIDKIHQPSREELIVAMRSREGAHKLYISTRTGAARVHFTANVPENPPAPPMFCMLLRKKLTGGRLSAIRQEGLERALYFDFDTLDELGDPARLTLAVELTGRHSNVILFDGEGRIVDALRRVDLESSTRPVLPGLRYAPPPAEDDKLDLSQCTGEALAEAAVKSGKGDLAKALQSVSHGLSPLLCREAAHRATHGRDTAPDRLDPIEYRRLVSFLDSLCESDTPYLVCRPDGTPLEFSCTPIAQYGMDGRGQQVESYSALLDTFFARRDAADRLRTRAQDLFRVLGAAEERIRRKLARQREELQRAGDRETLRIRADLINANLWAIPKGASSVSLVNYYDPDCAEVTVPLDPALSAAANAQKYYKDYRKAQTAERVLAEQIAAGEEELAYLYTVLDALSRAATLREIAELRQELEAGGYLRRQSGSRQKPPAPLGPMEFVSDDGFSVLVGRNNLQNDRLTLRTARGCDIWLHVKNIPGSHVIIITNGATPPDRTLEQAAILAATYSKAADSVQVPVDYTAVRHVHKPSGARPGMVIYDNQTTAYVDPDRTLAARLAVKNG